jgi:Na+/proline symporter
VPVLTHVDLLPIFLVIILTLGAGFVMKSVIHSAGEYLHDTRGLTAWIAVPALCGTFLGAPEALGMGALGADFGWRWTAAFVLGLVPALVLASRWSGTRLANVSAKTVAEFLGLRYGRAMRAVSAGLYVLLYLIGAGIALGVLGRTVQALHILDGLVRGRGWAVESIYPGVVMTGAVVALLAVLWGGFAGSVYSRSVQFCFLVAGFLPLTLHSVASVGGWAGLWGSFDAAGFPAGALAHPLAAWGLGLAAGVCIGSADFRLLQILLNCRDRATLRRVPLLALLPLLIAAFLLVAPGAVAPQMPTPRTSVTESEIEGAIVRTTTLARPEEEAGRGLVPAQVDAATGHVQREAGGAARLEYAMGTPKLAVKTLPETVLGMFLAALLAALLSGITAQLTAIAALVHQDLAPLFVKRPASDAVQLQTARWTAVGAMALAVSLAFALRQHGASSMRLLLIDFLGTTGLLAVMTLCMAAVHAPEGKPRRRSRQR